MKRSAALEARSIATPAADAGGARRAASRMVVRVVALGMLFATTYLVFHIATG